MSTFEDSNRRMLKYVVVDVPQLGSGKSGKRTKSRLISNEENFYRIR